jgi:rubredoxin
MHFLLIFGKFGEPFKKAPDLPDVFHFFCIFLSFAFLSNVSFIFSLSAFFYARESGKNERAVPAGCPAEPRKRAIKRASCGRRPFDDIPLNRKTALCGNSVFNTGRGNTGR